MAKPVSNERIKKIATDQCRKRVYTGGRRRSPRPTRVVPTRPNLPLAFSSKPLAVTLMASPFCRLRSLHSDQFDSPAPRVAATLDHRKRDGRNPPRHPTLPSLILSVSPAISSRCSSEVLPELGASHNARDC